MKNCMLFAPNLLGIFVKQSDWSSKIELSIQIFISENKICNFIQISNLFPRNIVMEKSRLFFICIICSLDKTLLFAIIYIEYFQREEQVISCDYVRI